jgi:integrase
MRPQAHHIFKSRHGIWYFRWVVPEELRRRFPALPREVKRSLKTADTREARAGARRLHSALVLFLSHGTHMSSGSRLPPIRPWTISLDPVSRAITEISVDPNNETAASLAEFRHAFDSLINKYAAAQAAPTAAPVTPIAAQARLSSPTILMSQAIADYGQLQIQSGEWSHNTFKHTHEPSLRLFQELIGDAMRADPGTYQPSATVDCPMEHLTREKLSDFLRDFWKFPAQQGKRRGGKSARETLLAGGPPQSRANVFKRLAHIRQFIAYCCKKNFVAEELLNEIDMVLSKNTARAREKAALAAAGPNGVIHDGYVAFNADDIKALFGPAFSAHVGGKAHRFWIPLLGLYAALRVGEASQLRPEDFVNVDGIECVRVTGESVGESRDASAQRVKTLASIRTIPLHPMLIKLGLLEYVERRRKGRESLMWDDLLFTEKSGRGKYPSRDFQKLAKSAGVYQPRRKVFHSFRSTIGQALEHCGLEAELIDRFLGHTVGSTRAKSYSRTDVGKAFPIRRVFEALSKVDFPVAVQRFEQDGSVRSLPRSAGRAASAKL